MQENFLKDKELVKKTVKQKKNFEDILNSYQESLNEINDIKDLFNLATQEKDEETIEDCNLKIDQIHKVIKKNEINCFLSGENDDYDIYLEIPASSPLCSLIISYLKFFLSNHFMYILLNISAQS